MGCIVWHLIVLRLLLARHFVEMVAEHVQAIPLKTVGGIQACAPAPGDAVRQRIAIFVRVGSVRHDA